MTELVSDYLCRECGITNIEPDTEIDGHVLCWVDDDLCSRCQDWLQHQLELDAKRYRHLRNRQTRHVDIAVGGVFAGRIPENQILGGEDLDRAIDCELGTDLPSVPTLERRLAECLAAIIDEPIFTSPQSRVERPEDIHLRLFRPDLSERAETLLEEAGL